MKISMVHVLFALILCSLVLVLPTTAAINGKIAFVSNRIGNPEIYVMNPDGTGQMRLTNNLKNDTSPVWSPDGTKIAFMSDRDGNPEIYVMNADGSGQTRLTNNPAFDGWIGDGSAWSTDGNKIRFISDRDGTREIYVVNLDGTKQTRITNNLPYYVMNENRAPTLSPNGNKITFSVGYPPAHGTEDTYIFAINVDGTGHTLMRYADGVIFDELKGSPDGKKLAYIQINPAPLRYSVIVMNSDGSGLKAIERGSFAPFSGLNWSPDSTKIAYNSQFPFGGPPWGSLTVSNADGSKIIYDQKGYQNDGSPAWSPDNLKIAYVSGSEGNPEIYVMNADGTGRTRLTNNAASDNSPAWGPATVTSSITVTSPNGGETWKRGTPHPVTWKYTGNPGPYVKIELLKAGVPVGTATYSTPIGSGGTGSYTWTISSGRAPGTNYRMRITSVSQPAISDTSNSDFTITA